MNEYVSMLRDANIKIAELEKENTSLDDQNKRVCTEVAELEAVADDLLNNSSFSIGFPFEHDKLEKLRGK
jgi:predicted nuclease with TOPRIM domain